MSTFFLICAAITAVPMVLACDARGAVVLSINPFFWTICAGAFA